MNHTCLRLLSALALCLSLREPGRPQGLTFSLLKGEVHSASQPVLAGYVADLYDVQSHREAAQADIHTDGSFVFRNVAYGNYEIRITNSRGQMMHQEWISVGASTQPVEIHLPREKIEQPPSGPVSVNQLRHPPARKAFEAFVEAQKFSQAGQFEKAAAELEKAVRISPDYAEAYTNLAAQHARLGRYEQAIGETARAMELTQPNAVDLCNLAFALYRLQRYGEALQAARTAVRIEPANDKAHYLLGTLLAMDRRTLREAVAHLERAVQSVPAARENLELARRELDKEAGALPGKTAARAP